jgi:hypothetical protein
MPTNRVRAALYALVIGAVVTFGLGVASMAAARISEGFPGLWAVLFGSDWVRWIGLISLAAGLVAGAAVVAWRLISPEPRWGVALLLLGAIAFLVLVWPTPWVYRQFGCTVVKVTRLTGHHDPNPLSVCAEPVAAEQIAGPSQ